MKRFLRDHVQQARAGTGRYARCIIASRLFRQVDRAVSGIVRGINRIPKRLRQASLIVLAGIGVVSYAAWYQASLYSLDAASLGLAGESTVDEKLIKVTSSSIGYSRSDEAQGPKSSVTLASSSLDSTGQVPYMAELSKQPGGGIKFADSKQERQFRLIPQFKTEVAQYRDGRVLYPASSSEKHVYTFKKNGIKEDIILTESPGDTASYSWKLELGNELEARMLPDGGVGIYSANSYLFGNVQVSDDKSQKLVDQARKNGNKTNLAFVIPAPYIVDVNGNRSVEGVGFELEGDMLTLTASRMDSRHYPLSIDPSIVVTTTADFQQRIGQDDGAIEYNTADEIRRRGQHSGAPGTISTSYFTDYRSLHASVVANGYLYILGGFRDVNDTSCKNTGVNGARCNDIQRMPINADGSLGTISTSYFNIPRDGLSAVAHNGYLYIMGGRQDDSDLDCKNTALTDVLCNDIQRMAINADGSVGKAFDNTVLSTITTSYFTIPREGSSSVAYNGYLYITGGRQSGTAGCHNLGEAVVISECNDIQRMPINADGSLGTISTSYFNIPRAKHDTVAYAGNLYITGGAAYAIDTGCGPPALSEFDYECHDIQRMPINADGSLGAIVTTQFNTPRSGHSALLSNGYIYIVGGSSFSASSACKNTGTSSGYCNDIQHMPINADGSLGAISTSYFNVPRSSMASVASNDFLYIAGGIQNDISTACVNTDVAIQYCNDIQRMPLGMSVPTANSTSYFTTPRSMHATVVAHGYLYIIGGQIDATGTACKNTGTSDTACNDIQRMPISADGSLGVITTSYFNFPRRNLSATVAKGYLYITGGILTTASTDCKNTGASITQCNDIQYMLLDPSTGAPGAISTSYFNTERSGHISLAYHDNLYVMGGARDSASTNCQNTGLSNTLCNDIQRMPINPATGALGTIVTSYFDVPRENLAAVVSKNFLYIVGGRKNSSGTICSNEASSFYCNDIQRLALGADGAVSSPVNAGYFQGVRGNLTAVATADYLYVIGGYRPSLTADCNNAGSTSNNCNDIQRFTLSADGSLGAKYTSYFVQRREMHRAVFYSGTMFVVGGNHVDSNTACVNTGVAGNYCNDIQRLQIGAADLAPIAASTNYFNQPRSNFAAVATNGFLYIVGGSQDVSDTACKNTGTSTRYCNDIQMIPINTNGTIGTITTTYFNTPRINHTAVAHNGYLYIVGGQKAAGTECLDSGSSGVCNDIQRFSINPSTGALTAPSPNTTYFNTARYSHAAVAVNNQLYILGGRLLAATTDCKNTGTSDDYCNDIQRMPLDPSTGAPGIISTSYFATPRESLTAVIAGKYLYLSGGFVSSSTNCKNTGTASNYCNDIQYMPINADGSLGGTTTSYFKNPRAGHTSLVYGGYLYIAGGKDDTSDTACVNTGTATTLCNDIQRLPIQADGSLGSVNTSYFSNPRERFAIATSSGYLMVIGGTGAVTTDCKNTGASNVSCNDIQNFMVQTPPPKAVYEKLIDIGLEAGQVTGFVWNGSSACGVNFEYRLAAASGTFGSRFTLVRPKAGITQSLNHANVRYIHLRATIDDTDCTDTARITDVSFNYITPPKPPTLIAPASGVATTTTPQFQLRSTDEATYARYKIDICSNADCSSIIRTIDQTASQTGWTGQDAQTGTAYVIDPVITNSTIATHDYQSPALSVGIQYWWRGYAIDPADSNLFSNASAIQSFTTQGPPAAPVLVTPAGGTISVINPMFQVRAADVNNDYLRYRIQICSDNLCSTVLYDFNQTTSQSGWTGQDTQAGTAYVGNASASSSTTATYTLNANLPTNTTHYWRAYAIDPGGSNSFGPSSAINSFQTGPNETLIRGNITIRGNTRIGN